MVVASVVVSVVASVVVSVGSVLGAVASSEVTTVVASVTLVLASVAFVVGAAVVVAFCLASTLFLPVMLMITPTPSTRTATITSAIRFFFEVDFLGTFTYLFSERSLSKRLAYGSLPRDERSFFLKVPLFDELFEELLDEPWLYTGGTGAVLFAEGLESLPPGV